MTARAARTTPAPGETGRVGGRLAGGGLLLLPTQALAEVCDKVRPGWDGGPVSALQEALFLAQTIPVLVLLIASAAAIRFRHQWVGLLVIVLWAVVTTVIIMDDPTNTDGLARAEGCLGSPALFVAVVAAICVAIVMYTLPRPKDDDAPT